MARDASFLYFWRSKLIRGGGGEAVGKGGAGDRAVGRGGVACGVGRWSRVGVW